MATVETLMLANHAEALNGLLYVHGGAWSHHFRSAPSPGAEQAPSQIALAVTCLFSPEETGKDHTITLRIVSAEGQEVLRASGPLTVPQIGPDEPISRAALAMNATLVFPSAGAYKASAELTDGGPSTVDFWVHDQLPSASAPEPFGGAGYL